MSANTRDWNRLLVNKVVFLTGAAGHIAKSIAKACYHQGARLVLGDLDPTATSQANEEIVHDKDNTSQDRLLVVKLDVADETSIEQAVQAAVDKWKTIDVLLNT